MKKGLRNLFSNADFLNLVTALSGILACLIVGEGARISAAASYSGDYSIVNHFISELGRSNATSKAYVFNHSLMVSGFLLLIFISGMGNFMYYSRLARMARIFGIIAVFCFSAIGYFTAETWTPHIIVASLFFACAMVSILLFSLSIIREKQRRFTRAIALNGFVIVAWYFVALLWPKASLLQSVYNPTHFVRPAVWMLTVLEWGYGFLIGSWVIMSSANLMYMVNFSFYRKRAYQWMGWDE
ncbi:MAG TPA: DUF998 domain-containing protein [Chitinophagales bacterium]|nr:DUF998 domain-containing protein [Chitinophagales bacterium]